MHVIQPDFSFPREFADILSVTGRSILKGPVMDPEEFARKRMVLVPDAIDTQYATHLAADLQRNFGGKLPRVVTHVWPGPKGSGNMSAIGQASRTLYTGLTPNNWMHELSVNSVSDEFCKSDLDDGAQYIDDLLEAFDQLGLYQMLKSASAQEYLYKSTGFHLKNRGEFQITEYENADYIQPHNDLHSTDGKIDYYVDMHLTVLFGKVRQLLMVQSGRSMNDYLNVANQGSSFIYLLPFWHQVCPMEGLTKKARRYILMCMYDMNRKQCDFVDQVTADTPVHDTMYEIVKTGFSMR